MKTKTTVLTIIGLAIGAILFGFLNDIPASETVKVIFWQSFTAMVLHHVHNA